MRVFFDREFVCFHIQRFGHDQIYNTQKNKNYGQVFYPPSGLSFFNWKRERDSGHKSSSTHNSRFPELLSGSGLSVILIGEMEMWRCPDYLFTVAESRGGII